MAGKELFSLIKATADLKSPSAVNFRKPLISILTGQPTIQHGLGAFQAALSFCHGLFGSISERYFFIIMSAYFWCKFGGRYFAGYDFLRHLHFLFKPADMVLPEVHSFFFFCFVERLAGEKIIPVHLVTVKFRSVHTDKFCA